MRALALAVFTLAACGTAPLDAPPSTIPGASDVRLRIDGISPSRASVEGGEPGVVWGAGFCADAQLEVDGMPVDVITESQSRLAFTLPAARTRDEVSRVAIGVRCGETAASEHALTYDPALVVRPGIVAYGPAGDRVRPDSGVWIQFNRAMDEASFTDNFGIEGVEGSVRWDPRTLVAAFVPDAELKDGKRAVAFIRGGSKGVRSSYGDPLERTFQWRFTTCKACNPAAP